MDSFSSHSSMGSGSPQMSAEDFKDQLKNELAQAYAQEFLESSKMSCRLDFLIGKKLSCVRWIVCAILCAGIGNQKLSSDHQIRSLDSLNEMMRVNLQFHRFKPNSGVCVTSNFYEEVLPWLPYLLVISIPLEAINTYILILVLNFKFISLQSHAQALLSRLGSLAALAPLFDLHVSKTLSGAREEDIGANLFSNHFIGWNLKSDFLDLVTVRDKCFAKCITKPGSSLSGSESSCISRCVERYIEATGIISRALLNAPR
ncbi:hypothetical protein DKX38_026158 [Salix brachista]|uniref:Tim10-like domain-containing protein n=1 Tax=Salix brachista TaxID=2182728 RepID=A0A5N5JRF6_9ROSI|nr:hypothetical protein DKX38_026158 [Salix brachista]